MTSYINKVKLSVCIILVLYDMSLYINSSSQDSVFFTQYYFTFNYIPNKMLGSKTSWIGKRMRRKKKLTILPFLIFVY